MSYLAMVTTDGQYVPKAILAHAHRQARIEFNGFLLLNAGLRVPDHVRFYGGDYIVAQAELAATVDRAKIKLTFSYAELLARELEAAWSYARAIRGAGKGEAPDRSMFRQAA